MASMITLFANFMFVARFWDFSSAVVRAGEERGPGGQPASRSYDADEESNPHTTSRSLAPDANEYDDNGDDIARPSGGDRANELEKRSKRRGEQRARCAQNARES